MHQALPTAVHAAVLMTEGIGSATLRTDDVDCAVVAQNSRNRHVAIDAEDDDGAPTLTQ